MLFSHFTFQSELMTENAFVIFLFFPSLGLLGSSHGGTPRFSSPSVTQVLSASWPRLESRHQTFTNRQYSVSIGSCAGIVIWIFFFMMRGYLSFCFIWRIFTFSTIQYQTRDEAVHAIQTVTGLHFSNSRISVSFMEKQNQTSKMVGDPSAVTLHSV